MKFVVFILSAWIFLKTISYGVFEIKKYHNKAGGIFVILISILSIIFPNVMVYIKGIY